MTTFMMGAAAMLLIALAFVVLPLVRGRGNASPDAQRALTLAIHRDALAELDRDRAAGLIDEAQYRIACAELERRVLDEAGAAKNTSVRGNGRLAAVLAAFAVPVIALPVYLTLGHPQAIDAPRQSAPQAEQGEVTPEQIQAMVARLAERMKAEPDNAEGWNMLARSYFAMGRFDEAVDAYANLARIVDRDAQVWVDHADALAMKQGRNLVGEPETLLKKALELDPDNVKALALAGSAAMQRGDAAGARVHWERLLKLLPEDSPLVEPIREAMGQADAGGGAR